MKKITLNLIILIYLILFSSFIFGQNIGEQWNCQTVRRNNIQIISDRGIYNTNPKIINIFIHIVKNNNGTGGLTDSQVNNSISILRLDYQNKNIFFNEIGREYTNNTEFYNGISNSNYNTLINTNRHNNAIDIYFLSPTDDFARASGIPGDALAFGGYYSETSVLSHEIGHCLGLYHTHSGSGCYDYANCEENIDGSNCSNCGDLVCDTPADPCLSGNVDDNCNYIGDDAYNPDINNIMSYAPPKCLSNITNGQKERLHNAITNNEILSQLSFAPEISGSNTICVSNQTYTLQNYPNNVSIVWSKSNNLNYINGQGTNNFTVEAYNNGYSGNSGWVQANINSIIIRKNILVGINATFNGSYN